MIERLATYILAYQLPQMAHDGHGDGDGGDCAHDDGDCAHGHRDGVHACHVQYRHESLHLLPDDASGVLCSIEINGE